MIFTTPLNGGDLGILQATKCLIEKYFPNSKLTIACFNYDTWSKQANAPQLGLIPELEDEIYAAKSNIGKQILSYTKYAIERTNLSGWIFQLYYFLFKSKSPYLQNLLHSDLVIASPGGYLHPYYGIENKTFQLSKLAKHKRKYVLLAQSISPPPEPPIQQKEKKLHGILKRATYIAARETKTFKNLNNYQNSILTCDIVFLLADQITPKPKQNRKPTKIVCNFRKWPDTEISKYVAFLNLVLNKYPEIQVEFLSTCQGITGYVDDSLIAQEIAQTLVDKNRITINQNIYTTTQLIEAFADHDLYLGMRLHGAIFSMIGGIPAMNISYEEKGTALYGDLGIDKHAVSLQQPIHDWLESFDYIYNNYQNALQLTTEAVRKGREMADLNVNVIKNALE
ncbi:MAG: polysaccharide pyruvyl transferase family protein [Saprospiraceae bacterium]